MLRPAPEKLVPASWSLLAGVAVFEAVTSVLPERGRLMLKWPNDLLLDGAKLAGVLIDSSLAPEGSVEWVVIGVGVNLGAAPEVPGRATSCLAQAGVTVGAEAMARLLAAELDRWQAAGFDAVRAAWLARAHPAGTRLRVQSGDQVLEGAFAGLTQDGRLRLDGAGEAASGDVEIIRGNAART
jgi:BirA family biotin operon repressor/biotin-[acetyl-CoA-carboxylase] ligase